MSLMNKVSIVTGGAQGLGKAIALELARKGSHLVVGDVNLEAAQRVTEEVHASGRRSLALRVDVSNARDVSEMADRVVKEFGRIDILVNNAGICQVVTIEKMTEEDWDRVMAINLKGVFLCSKAVMSVMKKQRSGRIVNMGSLAGKVGGIATGANYSVSKAGVMCFTKALARELAPYGVTVNAVAPGVIETDMTRGITQGDFTNYLKTIPLGTIGSAEDVSHAVAFLVSDEARYITGEILDVNGGMLMD
jgi:3-oxoacyl-[acyl-carrier protein] reductase